MAELTDEQKAAAEKAARDKLQADADRKAEHERIATEAGDKARKAMLAELGIDDPAKAKAALKAQADADAARLTEAERTKKILDDALDARGKLEAKSKALESERDAAVEVSRKVRLLSAQGVQPADLDLAAYLLDQAKAADAKLNETEWCAELKKARPYFFAPAAAPAPVTTSPPLPNPGIRPGAAPGVPGASPYGGNPPPAPTQIPGGSFNAMTATRAELAAHAASPQHKAALRGRPS